MNSEDQKPIRDINLSDALYLLARELRAAREERKTHSHWREALRESEARIIEAILLAAHVSKTDDELLAALDRRAESQTKRLEALDAKTPPAI